MRQRSARAAGCRHPADDRPAGRLLLLRAPPDPVVEEPFDGAILVLEIDPGVEEAWRRGGNGDLRLLTRYKGRVKDNAIFISCNPTRGLYVFSNISRHRINHNGIKA